MRFPKKLFIALAALSWYAASRRRAARAGVARTKPGHLQTWETEGGGVPVEGGRTAQQVRPAG
ncbi:MAG TPA: hypothetical protein VN680_04850 [Burkholderiaceae bacterium]|jgi:hypothetical protein|nr:hypothetical protein [Burkholderiaceae bacterium]